MLKVLIFPLFLQMSNYDEKDPRKLEKKRIKDAFDLFDQENKGSISREYVD